MRRLGRACAIVVLGAALAAWPGQLPGQAGRAPWAPTGGDPGSAAPAVIATSQPRKEVPPPLAEPRLPLPDDGLRRYAATTVATPTARALTPRPLTDAAVKRAVYLPDQVPARPRLDPAVIQATATQPVAAGSALAVEVVGPPAVQQGEALRCTVVVRNTGAQVLAGVRVELPLPAGMRVLASDPPVSQGGDRPGWALGNLAAGAEQRLRIDLQPADTQEIHLRPVAMFSAAVGLRAGVVVPPFGLQAVAPAAAALGEKVTLRLQVSNRTARPVRHVALHCRLGDGLHHEQGQTLEADLPGELAAGQTRSLELSAVARKAGTLRATFEAKCAEGFTAKADAAVVVTEPSLTLVCGGPRQASTGHELDYRLEVGNAGRAPSPILRLMQVLPDGLEFVSASTGGLYNPATQTITWALEEQPPGHRRAVGFRARARAAGDWALHAAVGGEGLPDVRATHAVRVTAAPVLAVELTALDDPIAPGQTTSYEVRVYNHGGVAAQNVRLRFVVPDNVLAYEADGPARWQLSGQNVLFEPVARMAIRTDAVYRIRVRGLRPGPGRFRAELTADGLPQARTQDLVCRVHDAAGGRR